MPPPIIQRSMSFADASAITLVSGTRFRADIPDGWQQGRGAFGGLVLATLLRAIERAEPDASRVTRSLSGDLCGPVMPGAAEVRVVELRRGNNQTNLSATLTQNDVVLAAATAVLSRPRRAGDASAPRFSAAPPPASGPWQDLPALPVAAPAGPVFAQHYEYRSGRAPFAGGSATVDGFIREREPLARVDAPALIGRLDAWWPTLFELDGTPRPVATISFTAQILVDPATIAPAAPLRYRARMEALNDGFFVEMRELWDGERVVALNQQTFAILR